MWVLYPLITLAACTIIDVSVVYGVHPLREHRGEGFQRHKLHVNTPHYTSAPSVQNSSKVCNVDVAVPEEAWQILIIILQAARGQPFEELSLVAQNPLSGLVCIHTTLSDDGLNQAKRLSVS